MSRPGWFGAVELFYGRTVFPNMASAAYSRMFEMLTALWFT
jgi:hypothetical protein